MEPWKQNQIDGRLARLEQELAFLGGSHDMLRIAVATLIPMLPEKDGFRAALKEALQQPIHHPNPAHKEGFGRTLAWVRQAMSHPASANTTPPPP